MLVAAGLTTAVSCVVVVVDVVAGSSLTTVVHDVRNTMVNTGRIEIRISFFISGMLTPKSNSSQVPFADVLEAKIFYRETIGTSRPARLEA